MEVLIALALAALGFGVVLHSLGLQMSLVAGAVDRHQMLMYASETLESTLSQNKLTDAEEDIPLVEPGDLGEEGEHKPARFFYSLKAKPVTADPRIQQVSLSIRSDRCRLRLSAYRLKVKRN